MKKYPIKSSEIVFGKLLFLDFQEQINETIGRGRDRKIRCIGNKYGLLSDKQDDVTLVLPSFVAKLSLNFMQPVKLVNPVLVAIADSVERGTVFVRWEVHADNAIPV
jgi:Bacterial protein of unknown function (DUF961).